MTLGRFELVGIPPAPRGVPQIEVTFAIDTDGVVNVSAKDLGTGKSQSIEVTASSRASQKKRSSASSPRPRAARLADQALRSLIDLRNKADGLMYSAAKTLEEFAEDVDESDASSLRAQIEKTQRAGLGRGSRRRSKRRDRGALPTLVRADGEALRRPRRHGRRRSRRDRTTSATTRPSRDRRRARRGRRLIRGESVRTGLTPRTPVPRLPRTLPPASAHPRGILLPRPEVDRSAHPTWCATARRGSQGEQAGLLRGPRRRSRRRPSRISRRPTGSSPSSVIRTAIRTTRRRRSASRKSPRPTPSCRIPRRRPATTSSDTPVVGGPGQGHPGAGFEDLGNFGDLFNDLFGDIFGGGRRARREPSRPGATRRRSPIQPRDRPPRRAERLRAQPQDPQDAPLRSV